MNRIERNVAAHFLAYVEGNNDELAYEKAFKEAGGEYREGDRIWLAKFDDEPAGAGQIVGIDEFPPSDGFPTTLIIELDEPTHEGDDCIREVTLDQISPL